jgi:hypothetical protein
MVTIDGIAQLPSIAFGALFSVSIFVTNSKKLSISNISENALYTTYQLKFGEGSLVQNYLCATIPSSLSHHFSSVICVQTFEVASNSFGETFYSY